MSITAHRMTRGDTGIKERLQMLAPSLAALLYPFALEGFNASVTRIEEGGAGALGLSWLGAAMCLALAFAVPLIAILAAMSLSGIERPTAATIARQAHGPTCRRGADLVRLRRRRSHHAARSGARHLALGRMLGDRARAAVALRQQRAGGARAPSHSGAAARRSRRVGTRPRHDLPDAPHRQPPDVPRRRRDVQRGDESIPPRLPHRHPAAAGGGALPLADWHRALFRLAADRCAH